MCVHACVHAQPCVCACMRSCTCNGERLHARAYVSACLCACMHSCESAPLPMDENQSVLQSLNESFNVLFGDDVKTIYFVCDYFFDKSLDLLEKIYSWFF